jgi:hypothetical protein
MCINFHTSIIAYSIGTITSLLLINNNNKEKKMIGYFILFYSLVQLLEALIYKNNKEIYSRLLLINLGLQGLVFILLLNNYTPINYNYIYIFSIIALYITYISIQPNFSKATTENGMNWNFINNELYYLFIIMYTLIPILTYKYSDKLNYMNKLMSLLLLTLIISFTINIKFICTKLLCNTNQPSIWCLSSAIVAPIILII